MKNFASLAQLVEQLIRNEQVVGSSPIGGSEKIKKDFNKSFVLSGKRDSNPRPSAWEADALPLSYSRDFFKSLTKIMNRFISAN